MQAASLTDSRQDGCPDDPKLRGRRGPTAHGDGLTDPLVELGQSRRAEHDLICRVEAVPGEYGRCHRRAGDRADHRLGMPVET